MAGHLTGDMSIISLISILFCVSGNLSFYERDNKTEKIDIFDISYGVLARFVS